MTLPSARLAITALFAFTLLSACGGGGDDAAPPPPPPAVAAPSALSYSNPGAMTTGSPITALNPTVTGTVTSYSVSPALPAGLTLNTTTGVITGTPTATAAATTYVVTATNAGGSTTFNLQITVNAPGVGVFMDSVVSGLSFVSGGQTGVTDANGRFTYELGGNVTFRVGGITLGTIPGKAVVTPLDFVPSSTSAHGTVQNIVRFLMLLDSDGNAANGITISEALRGRAANWTAVNFDTTDLNTALATVILDTQVDGTQRVLPDATTAQAHFDSAFRCMFSGYFKGTYAGDDNGVFAFTIVPDDGAMAGAAHSTPDDELFLLQFNPQQLQVNNGGVFAAGLALNGAQTGSSFSGTFPAYDQVSGTWTDGTFTGTRYAGTPTAAYKILTALVVPNPNPPPPPLPQTITIGSFFTEIDAAGVVTAESHVDFETGQQVFDLAVTQNGNTLTITDTNTGIAITGTLNLSGPSITGTFTNAQTGNSGTLNSFGCRLR